MSREKATQRAASKAAHDRRSKRALKIAVPTIAALGAGSAVAIGSIPSSDRTFTGCYYVGTTDTSERPGALRLIDPQSNPDSEAGSCQSDEKQVTWNQQGQPGQPGQPGQQGAKGDQGSPGAKGDQGFAGAAVITAAPGASVFVKIEGINGGSTNVKHKGEINALGFSFGSKNSGGSSSKGGGQGTGKTTFETFTFAKRLDQASPKLFVSLAKGEHIKKAVISLGSGFDQGSTKLKYTLENVLVSSLRHNSLSESVGLQFSKVTITFVSQDATGKSTEVTGGYDVATGKAARAPRH